MCFQEVKYPQKTSQFGAYPTSFGLLFIWAKRLNLFVEPVAQFSGVYRSERGGSATGGY